MAAFFQAIKQRPKAHPLEYDKSPAVRNVMSHYSTFKGGKNNIFTLLKLVVTFRRYSRNLEQLQYAHNTVRNTH